MRPDLNHFTSPRRPGASADMAQQLRDLPSELAPPYDFAEFRRRGRHRFMARPRLVTWPHAAAAAGVTAFIAAMAILGTGTGTTGDDEPERTPVASISEPSSARPDGARPANSSPANEQAENGRSVITDPDVAAAIVARETREWLARQPAEPVVMRAGPRIVVANLEDRIAWFDDALTDERLHGASSDRVQVLQRERARLVSSLAQVRFAERLVADGS